MVNIFDFSKAFGLFEQGHSPRTSSQHTIHVATRSMTGIDDANVEDVFRKTAIAEMKHAERLAERLDYLNGVPTIKPDPIFVGGSLIEMLKQDELNEEEAINLYKQAIQVAAAEGDYTTRHLLEEILAEEETHINTFGKLLVGMTEPFTQPGTSQI